MEFTSDAKIYSNFLTPFNETEIFITPIQKVQVQQNKVNFYDSRLIDWSNFAGVEEIGDQLGKHFNFYTTTLSPTSFKTNYNRNEWFGIYLVTLQQDMMFSTSDVTLLSLDNCLALIGGYAGTVWLLIICACGGFAQFAHQNSLVRDFIKKRRQNDQVVVGDEESNNDIEQVINSTEPVVFTYA